MSTLYDLIFELKCDLNDDEKITIELVNNDESYVYQNTRISCFDEILIIYRKMRDGNINECIIPLDKIVRVYRGMK